jgi:hypothetical protein
LKANIEKGGDAVRTAYAQFSKNARADGGEE